MKFRYWIITQPKCEPQPVMWYWYRFWIRRVPVRMIDMPVVHWLLLRGVEMQLEAAPYIVGVYLGISPERVSNMKAAKVIALFNHVKFQVEKCNRIYDNISSELLTIPDGVDRSHLEAHSNILLIYDLADGNILNFDKVEKMCFVKVMNWLHAKYLNIRTEQNHYMKEKQKMKAK